jgi:hypothetical protein
VTLYGVAVANLVLGLVVVVGLADRLARHSIVAFGSILIVIAVLGGSWIPVAKVRHARVALSQLAGYQSGGDVPQSEIESQASKILDNTLDIAFYPMTAVLFLLFLIAVIFWHMPSSAAR